MSLSARRAWIEIANCQAMQGNFLVALRKESVDRNDPDGILVFCGPVALRKESVDRNIDTQHLGICVIESLSARRAWIEISTLHNIFELFPVALRKESVDRNSASEVVMDPLICRSPQGERG